MKQDQTTEYVTAFVVGTLVGVGAALLFAPEPPTRREKVMKELKPYGKKLTKHASRARKSLGQQAEVAGVWGEELASASRAVMKDLREEVAELVADAREEIAASVEGQVKSARRSIRKGVKRARG